MWCAAGQKPPSAPQCLPERWLKLCMLLSDQTIKVNEIQIFVLRSYHILAGKHSFRSQFKIYSKTSEQRTLWGQAICKNSGKATAALRVRNTKVLVIGIQYTSGRRGNV